MSGPPEQLGAFPLLGPLTYLRLDPPAIRSALRGPYPNPRVWYHVTWETALASILRSGLIPSCWWGGDSCCVFGYDRKEDIPEHRRGGWLLELYSVAPPGQLKAWWVPASAIRGVWHESVFWRPEELRRRLRGDPVVTGDGCSCELSELVAEQQRLWRLSWQ